MRLSGRASRSFEAIFVADRPHPETAPPRRRKLSPMGSLRWGSRSAITCSDHIEDVWAKRVSVFMLLLPPAHHLENNRRTTIVIAMVQTCPGCGQTRKSIIRHLEACAAMHDFLSGGVRRRLEEDRRRRAREQALNAIRATAQQQSVQAEPSRKPAEPQARVGVSRVTICAYTHPINDPPYFRKSILRRLMRTAWQPPVVKAVNMCPPRFL